MKHKENNYIKIVKPHFRRKKFAFRKANHILKCLYSICGSPMFEYMFDLIHPFLWKNTESKLCISDCTQSWFQGCTEQELSLLF